MSEVLRDTTGSVVTTIVDEGDGRGGALSKLDRPLLGLVSISLEQSIYLLLVLLAFATRFWALGARAMSHDESLHALFSWKLYAGEGYVHDPMMHGPFLFHANALMYFLFGVTDFTARIAPALFSVAMVALPYWFRPYLGRAGALVASVFLLISPMVTYYGRYIRHDTYMLTWTILLALAMFEYLRVRKPVWLLIGATVLSLAITTMENAFIVGFVGLTFIVLALVWERLSPRGRAVLQAALAGLVAVLALAVVLLHLLITPNPTGAPTLAVKLTPNLVFVALLAASALAASLTFPGGSRAFTEAVRGITWQALRLPILVFVVIFVLLFTTFFTNPKGLYTGSIGAVSYWLAQQPVQRGSQPWYYYIFLMPFYELIPYFIGIPAVGYYVYRGARRRLGGAEGGGYWVSYLVYWACTTFVIYSWAGEKMPWLLVHPTVPLLLISAQVIGHWLQRQDWRAWLAGGGLALCGILALIGVSALILLRARPFAGMSLMQLQTTGRWIGAVVVLLLSLWGVWRYRSRLGSHGIATGIKATVLLAMVLLTVRFAWMFNYVNYDYVSEFGVYAHGSPDLKVVLRQMEEISRRTAGDKELRFSYDQANVWPLEWYFRDWPNRIFYGNEPTKTAMEVPVVLVNADNEAKAKPLLGDRYYRFEYRLVWWPMEEYKGLTPAHLIEVLRDPARLDKWLSIWFYRRYPTPFSDWPYQDRFYLYISKDVLNQMWDMGVTLAIPSEAPTDPYQQVWQDKEASVTIGGAGTADGLFTSPRGIAVAAKRRGLRRGRHRPGAGLRPERRVPAQLGHDRVWAGTVPGAMGHRHRPERRRLRRRHLEPPRPGVRRQRHLQDHVRLLRRRSRRYQRQPGRLLGAALALGRR